MSTLLFPRNAVDQGAITQNRQRANKVVQDLARGTNTAANLLVRNFRPSDTTTNGGTPTGHLNNPAALVANTYLNDVFPNCTTKPSQAFAIFGIVLQNAAPKLDEITVYVGAEVVAVLPLQEIQSPAAGTTPQMGWIFDPIWVPPQTHLRIDLLAGTAANINTENFGLIGYVGEGAGSVVSSQHVAAAGE